MGKIICRMKNYIQPFERELALRELQALSKTSPIHATVSTHETNVYVIDSDTPFEFLQERLTYWEELEAQNKRTEYTKQVLIEASSSISNGNSQEVSQLKLPFSKDVKIPNRRVLRYGPHGVHEYRGKFFPQLVRSLLNVAGVDRKSIVLDTMCGSGTTPLEALLLGCRAFAMDINPLSVLMSRVKCKIMTVEVSRLREEYKRLNQAIEKCDMDYELTWFKSLPESSQNYLENWFCHHSLMELDFIVSQINRITDSRLRDFFGVCLSNILRKISFQKTDDLRVRREENTKLEADVFDEFGREIEKSVKMLAAFLLENKDLKLNETEIIEGDATRADTLFGKLLGKVDAIITSPPYATALPYLDTDRLSLYYLNLVPRYEHRRLDLKMIGNREISNKSRREYLQYYEANRHILPSEIIRLIDLIELLNRNAGVGFRRQNLPALLSNYFFSMRKVFQTYLHLLKPNSLAYVVVGNNHTIAGGKRIEISTDSLLAQLGDSVGLKIQDTIPMEMLASRDIFRKNSSSAETIIIFRKTQ